MKTFTFFLLLVTFVACQKTPEPPKTETTPATPAINKALTEATTDPGLAEAQKIFTQRCVMCHGANGTGNGVAAANLNPKPRNYTDKAWQASITDEALQKIIVGGGDSVGKSMMMPANPDLKEKPEVVNGLVKIIRGFGQ
jgi:mono/diheme cytochrome c family protein